MLRESMNRTLKSFGEALSIDIYYGSGGKHTKPNVWFLRSASCSSILQKPSIHFYTSSWSIQHTTIQKRSMEEAVRFPAEAYLLRSGSACVRGRS